ncbi:26824_t:CDS:2, partial [Racocetra persica]
RFNSNTQSTQNIFCECKNQIEQKQYARHISRAEETPVAKSLKAFMNKKTVWQKKLIPAIL